MLGFTREHCGVAWVTLQLIHHSLGLLWSWTGKKYYKQNVLFTFLLERGYCPEPLIFFEFVYPLKHLWCCHYDYERLVQDSEAQ